MGESLRSQLFINSEQVGDFIEVTLPATGEDEESEVARIHYLEAGVGEPLLLIHSVGQSLYTWRNVFAELSDNYRVIALDLPGHGYSSRPDSFTYTADDMAAVLNLFLDALNVKSAHMIGFSLGAMYMLRFLSLYPRRVANCVAISPGGITEQMPKLIQQLQTPLVATFARNLYTASNVRALLKECVSDETLIDDHVVKQYYEPIADGLAREAIMYALRNFDMDAIAEGLMPVEHEVLVLWGKNDRWHPPAGSVYFQSLLRTGRYYLVRNAGHLLQEEAPSKLLEIVYSYIPPAVPSYDVYRYTQHLAEDEDS
ncbi:MAG: alpha/beta fold hydrolase [Christensenella sp.]|nr:alpha/beta fold hydrolase [Christensenella sp.]